MQINPRLFGRTSSRARRAVAAATMLAAVAALAVGLSGAGRKFYDDDPIAREPEPQDASGAEPWDIGLIYDLGYHLFVQPGRNEPRVRAKNINTIDEVPDSSWFTNRLGAKTMSADEVVTGPNTGPAPDPVKWTIVRPKSAGASPGFTATDANGETWFVSFDPPAVPQGATAAIVVATKIFWALGYNQVENFLTSVRAEQVEIASSARMRRPSGVRTPMTEGDLRDVFHRSARDADGSYRAAAGRLLTGKILGGFRYKGTRPDDPNDIVPHEHRRELRALRVFGAWLNLTDMKAGNTLDTVVTDGGRGVVKHYLQDVGSTFGIGATGWHDWDDGWEYLYEGKPTLKRFGSLGFWLSPWQTVDYELHEAVGPFEGERFDPRTWRPHAPTAAYFHLRADDAFWAARRVMAFSDDLIRAVVKTGQYSEAKAEQRLADVLIQRRDKIGRVYLPAINPLVDPELGEDGALTFGNAAVEHGVAAAPEQYKASWFSFDNATGESTRIGETTSTHPGMQAPAGIPRATGGFVRVELSAVSREHPAWALPIQVYFRKLPSGWKLVGLERLPEPE